VLDNRFLRIYDPNASRTAKALRANLNRRAFGFYMPADAVFAKSGIWGIKQKWKKRHPFRNKAQNKAHRICEHTVQNRQIQNNSGKNTK
jgi:hypothetical protein